MTDAGRPDESREERSFRPSASIEALRERARSLVIVRQFFSERGYWEVDTPTLSADTCVDAHIDPIKVPIEDRINVPIGPTTHYLQTSPEFAMKRLLAAGSGSIFQISHAFRAGEKGRLHNREFTLIEWYKLGASLDELMTEVGELVTAVTGWPAPKRAKYRDLFQQHVGVDPLTADEADLARRAADLGWTGIDTDRPDLLNFLWADRVEPNLGFDVPLFVFDFPGSMAALAKTAADVDGSIVARRFELYVRGVELCNGYDELTDWGELQSRFRRQNERRKKEGKGELPIDSRLAEAMRFGLPESAGVALGFDRLLMLSLGLGSIAEVISFPDDTA